VPTTPNTSPKHAPGNVFTREARAWLLPVFALLAGACSRASGGDLSVEQLNEVVAREHLSLEPCYQTSLDNTPYEHDFRLLADLRIRPDGRVAELKLDQTGLRGLGPCVDKAIRSWRFPTAETETRARLPIIFQPRVLKAAPQNLPKGFRTLTEEERKR